MNKVSIATKPLVYSTFRYINNTPWNALAEYIDNSLQSFNAHKDVLSKINHGGKVRIDINIDSESIVITDNAWGIEAANYQRAFELANIPLDATGLSEFGMGMKVSSIWFSNVWKVETCAYGECVKKTVVFDLNKVVENQETDLRVQEEPAGNTEHYTVITLTQLSQNRPKQLSAIKKHLSSTYVKFIRDGVLDLVINGELMTMPEPKILHSQYYSKVNGTIQKVGEPVLWREEINFAPQGSKYKVTGFIGVLEKMSTSSENGFLIFRRGRAIGHSGDDKYRPQVLCGQVGSPQYKRIFGELSVEGFEVSFQKNSFQEDEAFTGFIADLAEDLKSKIKRHLIKDLFGQAQNFVKDKSVVETKKLARKLITTIAKSLTEPIVVPQEQPSTTLFDTTPEAVAPAAEVPNDIKEAAQLELPITPIQIEGKTYRLKLQTIADGAKTGLYHYTELEDGTILAQINMTNKFFDMFEASEEELERIMYFIKILLITEISVNHSKGTLFRTTFNKYFGAI